MNKGELIERLSGKLGDQKTSSKAVDALINEIEQAVSSGEKVNISGFGVFEKRERAARTGRNPRTGEPIKVQKSTVPAFRPGATFKTLVSGGSGSRSNTSAGGGSGRGRGHTNAMSQAQPARSQSRSQPKAQSQSRGQGQSRGHSGRAQQTAYAQNNAVTVKRPSSHAKGR